MAALDTLVVSTALSAIRLEDWRSPAAAPPALPVREVPALETQS